MTPQHRRPIFLLGLALIAGSGASAAAEDARCDVWARELGFARTVAEHDRNAFSGYVHPHAVFSAESQQPQFGRDAILDHWEGLINGAVIKLSWYPQRVVTGGDGDVAVSSGPALYERLIPKAGEPDFRIGGFHSVWQRGNDNVWRVVFDEGIEPRAAGEADIEAFRSGRREKCPLP